MAGDVDSATLLPQTTHTSITSNTHTYERTLIAVLIQLTSIHNTLPNGPPETTAQDSLRARRLTRQHVYLNICH